MEYLCGELKGVAELLVVCNRGLLSNDPDKTGKVFTFGGDGRKVLSLVEQAAMLASEYPEDCQLLPAASVAVRERDGGVPQNLDDVFILVAEHDGKTRVVLAPGLAGRELKEAMSRLKRYATRLTRMDVP